MNTKKTTDFLMKEAQQAIANLRNAKTDAGKDKYKKILLEIKGRMQSHLRSIDKALE